jgi:hypothetical protein
MCIKGSPGEGGYKNRNSYLASPTWGRGWGEADFKVELRVIQ